jgi:hypothetical protein
MTLGSPSITTPPALNLRALQTAVSNIRQRLEAAEAALTSAGATASQSNTSALNQINALQQQLTALAARVLALENATETDFGSYIAGETIAANQGVVPLGDGTVGAADASDPTRMFGLIGIATNAANAGAAVTVQRRGQYTVLGASFVPNRAVYVTFHGLTQHPDYEATALFIGMAVTSTAFFVAPEGPALLTPLYSSAIESIYEDYLPVTYRALQFLAGLESQIAALPFSSGVDPNAQVPVVIGGVAVRVNAGDIAALTSVTMLELFSLLPFQSGASSDMLVPVEIGGAVVLVRAGDIAALGGGGGGLVPIADKTLLSNISGSSATPIGNALSAILDDILGSTQGQIITRNGTVWTVISPGASGTYLGGNGPGANVSYSTPAGTGGTSKVTKSAVGLGTQAANQTAFTYTTIASVAARGLMSLFLLTATAPGLIDVVIRGAGADSGSLWLQAIDIQPGAYQVTLPIYYENDAAGQDFFIGWRNRGNAAVTLTLTSLRIEKFA